MPRDASKSGTVIRNPLAPRGAQTGALALCVSLVVLSSGARVSADEPVPPQIYDSTEYPAPGTSWRLAAAGVGMTVVWYGGAVGLSQLWPSAPAADRLMYPVAGPWIALSHSGCPDSDPGCSLFWVVCRAILTGIDGVGQAGGLALLAEAAFLPTSTSSASAAVPKPKPTLTLQATPLITPDSTGLSLFGRF